MQLIATTVLFIVMINAYLTYYKGGSEQAQYLIAIVAPIKMNHAWLGLKLENK